MNRLRSYNLNVHVATPTNDISVEPTNKLDKKKQGKVKERRGNISCKIHHS